MDKIGWNRPLTPFEQYIYDTRGELGLVEFVLRYIRFCEPREIKATMQKWYPVTGSEVSLG